MIWDNKLEALKDKLNKLVIENIENLSNSKVVQCSQALDEYIVEKQKELVKFK